MPTLSRLLVLLGPTASGKSALALEVAQKHNGVIISADSRQIYRGMDIGTAKPSASEQALVPHELLDIRTPDQSFSVAEYKQLAEQAIFRVAKSGRTPLLVGGTMQYIDAITQNWIIPPAAADRTLRDELDAEPLERLAARLRTLDPEAAITIDMKNKRRVIRALEIIRGTGLTIARARRRGRPKFEVLKIGLELPREEIYRRIDARVDAMIATGLVNEVRALADQWGWEAPGLSAVGYAQLQPYLESVGAPIFELQTYINEIKKATRHYAKRQLTWWRRDATITWCADSKQATIAAEKFISK